MNVTAEARSSNSIFVSWDPPLEEERNGLIIKYTVRYSATVTTEMTNKTSDTSILLTGLSSNTQYYVEVRAQTSVGGGPFSTKDIATTPREGTINIQKDINIVLVHTLSLLHQIMSMTNSQLFQMQFYITKA